MYLALYARMHAHNTRTRGVRGGEAEAAVTGDWGGGKGVGAMSHTQSLILVRARTDQGLPRPDVVVNCLNLMEDRDTWEQQRQQRHREGLRRDNHCGWGAIEVERVFGSDPVWEEWGALMRQVALDIKQVTATQHSNLRVACYCRQGCHRSNVMARTLKESNPGAEVTHIAQILRTEALQ